MRAAFLITFATISVTIAQSEVLIMSPESESVVNNESVLVAASLLGVQNISSGSVRLLLNGMDVTNQAYVDSDMISCLLNDVEPGNHEINLFVNGVLTRWSFTATAKESSMKYSGRIRSSSSMDQIDDQTLNINKMTLDFKGSAYDWLSMRTNLKVTSQENSLYQPRNIYGLQLGLKDILTLRLGDSNPRVSHFTMNGKRIRGMDLDFSFGWFNFRYLQGEINRAVQGALSSAYSFDIDTDEFGEKYIALDRSGYTFTQNVSSARVSFGSGDIFQWGFNYMKARDDTSSVDPELMDAQIFYESDQTGSVEGLTTGTIYTINELGTRARVLDGSEWSGSGPKDNLVISSDIGMNLFSKRIRLDGEVAFSMTNNNIWGGPLSLGELDTLIDDSVDNKLSSFDLSEFPDPSDWEEYLIINSNLSPLVPIDINAFGDSSSVELMDAIFSMPSLAYRGRAITNFYGNYFSIEYSQTGPEFNSLANPYLVKNKREWAISDKFKLFKNRLMLNFGYKHQDDDILTNVENVKTQNTLSFGFNALPGPGLPTLNFTYRSIDRNNGITELVELPDMTTTDNREKTQTNNLMLNVNHRFDFVWNHSISGTFVSIEKEDKFSERAVDFVDPSMLTSVINVSLITRYNLPLQTSFNITSNSSELSTGPGQRGTQDFLTANLSAEYPFLGKKILANGGFNYANGSGVVEMSWLGVKGGLRWRILDDLSLNAQGEFRSKETAGISKNTIIARANLEYSF
tara:strand:+ start:1493 stop:3724 length:2232 start_codon:yes stop_codon:yes gene_type:complete